MLDVTELKSQYFWFELYFLEPVGGLGGYRGVYFVRSDGSEMLCYDGVGERLFLPIDKVKLLRVSCCRDCCGGRICAALVRDEGKHLLIEHDGEWVDVGPWGQYDASYDVRKKKAQVGAPLLTAADLGDDFL